MGTAMPGHQSDRAIHYAVLASLLIHGWALFGLAPRTLPWRAAPPEPLVARLAEPPPAAVEPATAPVARPEPVKPEPLKPKARAKRPMPKEAAPAPAPPVAEAPSAPVAAAPASPAPAEPALEPASAPSATPVAPPVVAKVDPGRGAAPGATPDSARTVDEFRIQLLAVARKHLRYPPVAVDNNWEGNVVVRMVIGANGALSALSVKTSSGHAVLDRQALEMFRKAQSQVPVPTALHGKEFAIEVRAIYNLKDQGSG